MKIAFTTKGTQWDSEMDPRFGRAAFFILFDEEKEQLTSIDNSAGGSEAHGAGPKAAQTLFEHNIDVIVTGNGPGGNAAAVIDKAGIKVLVGAGEMTMKQAYEAYKKDELATA